MISIINSLKKILTTTNQMILDHYQKPLTFTLKNDNTPLTKADQDVHHFLIKELSKQFTYPILSEENPIDFNTRKKWSRFWLIDPIDGTKHFLKKDDEFCTNIALIENNRPILGIISIPVTNTFYWAIQNKGSFINDQPIIHKKIQKKLIIAKSKFHYEKNNLSMLNNYNYTFIEKGSAIKFCLLANGEIDIYPRQGPTMEWDTAAGDIIIHESNCQMVSLINKQPLLYNKKDLKNPNFIAFQNNIPEIHAYLKNE
ncbi:3'(2'),5'-bisphosphate nucleotidase [Candidatus Marinamargulisbacteria bacterium SCGC AG-410-N11]|nr:3'(2'),5'-bisphosphate nucleotidase [Candidatus Marinamargulisbacteria bacterium SCGC AG-410-N11]